MRTNMEKSVWVDIDDTIAITWPIMVSCGVNYLLENNQCVQLKLTIECEDDLYFADVLNLQDDQLADFFDKKYPNYLTQIVPDTGAKEFLHSLKKYGYEINLISSRRERDGLVEGITRAWLKNHAIPYNTLTINCKNKASFLKNKKGFFIDDSYSHCATVSQETELVVIQKRCPLAKAVGGVFQGYHWQEMLDYILATESELTVDML